MLSKFPFPKAPGLASMSIPQASEEECNANKIVMEANGVDCVCIRGVA